MEEMNAYNDDQMMALRLDEPQTTSLTSSPTPRSTASRCPRAEARLRHAADPRRHRHDVERDRVRAVALRPAPDQRARLVAAANDDLLWQTAIEEVLRYYAPVTMGRQVLADTEVAGCPVHAGDQVLVTFPAANHDPAAFEDAHEFRIDRAQNRHVAFGLGDPPLPRLQPRPARAVTVALQEWLRAFPDYELDPSTRPRGRTARSAARATSPSCSTAPDDRPSQLPSNSGVRFWAKAAMPSRPS
jgi:hypothetical protein